MVPSMLDDFNLDLISRHNSKPDNRHNSKPDNRHDSKPDNRHNSKSDNRHNSKPDNKHDSKHDKLWSYYNILYMYWVRDRIFKRLDF